MAWCCPASGLWCCRNFAVPNMCYIKGCYMPILTGLCSFCNILLLLSLSHLLGFSSQPQPVLLALSLFSKEATLLFLLTLFSAPCGNIFLFLQRSSRTDLLCSQREKGSYVLPEVSLPKKCKVCHRYLCLMTLCWGHLPPSYFSQGSWGLW